MSPSSIAENSSEVNTKPITDDAFVTPDGRIWSCHHGVHGFVVEQIIAEIGLEGARGSLLLLAEGTWLQEQATGVITSDQQYSIEMLATFPPCGIQTAAASILETFQKIANDRAKAEQAFKVAAKIAGLQMIPNYVDGSSEVK